MSDATANTKEATSDIDITPLVDDPRHVTRNELAPKRGL
jgi:hypothetical protein